jgi:glutamate synthase (ferredoxin)
MTGGCVVILGSVGKNFAAGMSGGIAYVFDDRHELYLNLNKELVSMEAVTAKYDAQELRAMIERHVKETGSSRGKVILENWEETLPLFKKIVPNDYRFMLSAISRLEEKGISREAAELDAFYALQQGKE